MGNSCLTYVRLWFWPQHDFHHLIPNLLILASLGTITLRASAALLLPDVCHLESLSVPQLSSLQLAHLSYPLGLPQCAIATLSPSSPCVSRLSSALPPPNDPLNCVCVEDICHLAVGGYRDPLPQPPSGAGLAHCSRWLWLLAEGARS